MGRIQITAHHIVGIRRLDQLFCVRIGSLQLDLAHRYSIGDRRVSWQYVLPQSLVNNLELLSLMPEPVWA